MIKFSPQLFEDFTTLLVFPRLRPAPATARFVFAWLGGIAFIVAFF